MKHQAKQQEMERKRYSALQKRLRESKVSDLECCFLDRYQLNSLFFFPLQKAEEKEKIKNGKKPFFLKNSVKRQMALELRYAYLNAYFVCCQVLLTTCLVGLNVSPRLLQIKASMHAISAALLDILSFFIKSCAFRCFCRYLSIQV